ncbi:hypothetical protein N4Q63_23725 [Leclercia adecarboxylata]|uniref:DUF1496 domain-containing protein n=1 Tax=Leclercia adecarboxylata TaxID=83655 RepID=A0A9X3YF80_9ENTR|nr:hypothetical protein [Leclercia adecarboxylata]MBD1404680.1 hypothetical protein [Leclercia adecarboxylata]MDC6625019.1 hypothetical protein [Leclercia adecarboxylata]MDC6635908.1 hypothetical protein [Leclercia adecarboxylata]MDC6641166.1 hypothetical protein [Leclercia adecarboxylata]MDC6651988.1 hypothetical protein [Leclercia adecarboxylata]
MIKMIGLGLLLVSITAFAADDKAQKEDFEKAQREITLSGYQCDTVNSIKTETSWFSSETTLNVTCDKAYHFLVRYERGVRVSVEVVSM